MRFTKFLAVMILGTGTALAGCNEDNSANKGSSPDNTSEGEIRQGVDQSYKLPISENFDETINGAKITLNFDGREGGVVGTVVNKAAVPIEKVTLNISLSSGKKLEATTFENLQPGDQVDVKIETNEENFNRWTVDATVSGTAVAIPDPADDDAGDGAAGDGNASGDGAASGDGNSGGDAAGAGDTGGGLN